MLHAGSGPTTHSTEQFRRLRPPYRFDATTHMEVSIGASAEKSPKCFFIDIPLYRTRTFPKAARFPSLSRPLGDASVPTRARRGRKPTVRREHRYIPFYKHQSPQSNTPLNQNSIINLQLRHTPRSVRLNPLQSNYESGRPEHPNFRGHSLVQILSPYVATR